MDANENNIINSSWTSTMYVGDRATESHSAMSRLNSRMGIRRSGASAGCAYIMLSKIRKALRKASEQADEKMRITYDRLTSKLEKLSILELEYIQFLLLTVPFDEMVATLRVKATMIRKLAAKWKKTTNTPDVDIVESDDPTSNVMKYSEDIAPEDVPED